jgi:hypothetical protein
MWFCDASARATECLSFILRVSMHACFVCVRVCVCLHVPASGAVRDPMIVTTLITAPDDHWHASAAVEAVFLASVTNLDADASVQGKLIFSIPELNIVHHSASITIPAAAATSWIDVALPTLSLAAVELWWPHNLGPPRLYNVSVSFVVRF